MPNPLARLTRAAIERLRHFELLNSSSFDFGMEDGWEEVLPSLSDDKLFLDTYTEEILKERFDYYGITKGLRRAGIKKYAITITTADPGFQHLEVFSREPRADDPVAELTLHKGNFSTRAPFAERLHGETIPMLFIQWIRLQNPLKSFLPDRPPLPGQKHPGLGIGDQVMVMLAALGEKQHTEGLANTPEYPHNAMLYCQRFQYINPDTEGKLVSLRRDFSEVPLSDLSWGILLGCVRDKKTGAALEWPKEEQILPLGPKLKKYFHSRAYLLSVLTSSQENVYELDLPKLATLPRVLDDKPPSDHVVMT